MEKPASEMPPRPLDLNQDSTDLTVPGDGPNFSRNCPLASQWWYSADPCVYSSLTRSWTPAGFRDATATVSPTSWLSEVEPRALAPGATGADSSATGRTSGTG